MRLWAGVLRKKQSINFVSDSGFAKEEFFPGSLLFCFIFSKSNPKERGISRQLLTEAAGKDVVLSEYA